MNYSSYQPETPGEAPARARARGAGPETARAPGKLPGVIGGTMNNGAYGTATDSIGGGTGAARPQRRPGSAVDVAHSRYGNRATLQFVQRRQALHAARTGPPPLQMMGGPEGRTGGAARPKKPGRGGQTGTPPPANVMPPLGVSRKYNPVSRALSAANERGVDPAQPRNSAALRTAGDIVGPLPGPSGHREFFYIISAQDKRVHGSMTEIHAIPGLLKLDGQGQFEDGIMMHRLRDDYVMQEEEFALGPDGRKIPSATTKATDAGWMAGGIPTSAYRARGQRSLAVGYNIEMVRAQQGLFQGAMGIHIFPIGNYDEMRRLFEMHLNPSDKDRVTCEDVNTIPGLVWLIDAATERNPVRSCLDLHNVLLKRAKVVDAGGRELDLGVRHPQSVVEHYRTLGRMNREYFRFYDREDSALRVAVHNNFMRRMLDPYAAADTTTDEYNRPRSKPPEQPPPRMPYPHELDTARGFTPEHNPYASFTDPDLLAGYLTATASELPEHLDAVWESMPEETRSGAADAIVRMSRALPVLRERRSVTEDEQEKAVLDRKILPYEQVLERGGLGYLPEDIRLLAERKMAS